MKRLSIWLLLFIGCWLCHSELHAKDQNELVKAVLHDSSAHPSSIERGNLMLYFSHEPLFETKHVRHGQEEILTIFFPHTAIQSSGAKAIDELNATMHEFYTLKFTKVNQPVAGLLLTISYDVGKTAVSYDLFDTIRLQRGFVLNFYNKNLIKRLQADEKPALLMAWQPVQPGHIVIDSGHGGSDDGASGWSGLKEKDVTLLVGTNVATLLEKQQISSFLTRDADVDVSFSKRTGLAHIIGADALVSIHANWAPQGHQQGVETFYCNLAPSVGARFSSLDEHEWKIISAWYQGRNEAAKKLANLVHRSLLQEISLVRTDVRDRGVKQAGSQLLFGSKVPAILVEVGFLSNEHEETLLRQEAYRSVVANGIAKGIVAYVSPQNG